MNLFSHADLPPAGARRHRQGFTLVEMMITVVLMALVIAGILSAQYIGMREDQLMESKAGASDTSRQAVSLLLNDIKGAKGYAVGTMTGAMNAGNDFSAITNGSPMQGVALCLYTAIITTNQTINLTNYTLYYFDTSESANNNGILWRLTSTAPTPTVVVSNLINTLFFTSEDYLGNTQTVRTFKGVVHATLQFAQFQYPLTPIGTNGLYDYYRIDCRATPHLPDGP